jgi:hypothetical protein
MQVGICQEVAERNDFYCNTDGQSAAQLLGPKHKSTFGCDDNDDGSRWSRDPIDMRKSEFRYWLCSVKAPMDGYT